MRGQHLGRCGAFAQIVQQHGGRISIETSDTLGGASFRVWLPLAPITHAADDTSGRADFIGTNVPVFSNFVL